MLPEVQQQQNWNVSEDVDGDHCESSVTWLAETQQHNVFCS